tara:strand:+ start:88 stop:663 length:576 start_codon:yes stop_codon:yes gene_type:complete
MAIESDLIRRYRGAVTPEECDEIISHIEHLRENSFMAYDKSFLHKQDHISLNLSQDWTVDLPTTSRISELTIPRFQPCVEEYLSAFSILNECKFLVYDLKLKKIPIGGGFHSWHFENSGIQYSQRVFVCQLYLNDDFDGGETEFLYQNRREEAVKGDVIMFPAGFTHTHRGNPPIGNPKYIATSWGLLQNE